MIEVNHFVNFKLSKSTSFYLEIHPEKNHILRYPGISFSQIIKQYLQLEFQLST